jgi:hypothetical protein
MKPLFGTLNASLSKAMVANTPKKYTRLVEIFGDSGTLAFDQRLRKPKEHILNIANEDLFFVFNFVKDITSGERASLKKMDWISSEETFNQVMNIKAEAGPERFYKFMYLKKFGMQMDKGQPLVFDVLSTGKDITMLIYAIPGMKVALKKTKIVNEDPFSLMLQYGGSDDFMVILPRNADDAANAELKLNGISGSFFFAVKRADANEIIEDAKRYPDLNVSALITPSIMMAKMSAITNYKHNLALIESEDFDLDMDM